MRRVPSLLLLAAVRGDPPGDGWVLTLEDTFDTFNTSLWTKGWSWYNGTGFEPGQPQPRVHVKASDTCYFADENVDIHDGYLVLTNKRERSHGFNYTSGVVNSIKYGPAQGFQQTYGYFEARIKASPGGKNNLGMCPAFWLPNVRNNGDDGNCEIDVMEIPGGLPFGNGKTVYGTLHNGLAEPDVPDCGCEADNCGLNTDFADDGWWSDDFHDYAVRWEPGLMEFYVDGKVFGTINGDCAGLVPDTPAYMVLDNEVGLGHKDGPDGGWAGNPENTTFPQVMLVDHVRVWQRASLLSSAPSSPLQVL